MWVEAICLRVTGMKFNEEELKAATWRRGYLTVRDSSAALTITDDTRNGHIFPQLAPARVKRIDERGILIVGIETIFLGEARTYPQAWWCRPPDLILSNSAE
jgi:hypothetical protein